MKLKKSFYGVRDGDIYPVWFQPGDECPAELYDAAHSLGAIEDATVSPAAESAPDLALELEAAIVDRKVKK